jgi:hypothetical protein
VAQRPAPASDPVAPAARAPAGNESTRESTVQKALNALAACAESLADPSVPGPAQETCRAQLAEARRLIATLEGATPSSGPSVPPAAREGGSSPRPPRG